MPIFISEHFSTGIDDVEIMRGNIFSAPAEHKITEYGNRCATESAPDLFLRFPLREIWKVTILGRHEKRRLFFFLPRSREIKGRTPRRRQVADNVR